MYRSQKKTDIIDSLLIAELLRYGDFLETSLSNEDYLSLRNLSRFRSYLVSSIDDLKRKTIALLDQVFSDYYKKKRKESVIWLQQMLLLESFVILFLLF